MNETQRIAYILKKAWECLEETISELLKLRR